MVIGLILSGMILGVGAAIAALISGFAIWSAILFYVLTGSLWVLGGTAVMAVRSTMGGSLDAQMDKQSN